MKIVHLIDSGGLYGAEKMLLFLVKQQVSCGHEAKVVSYGASGEGSKPLEKEAERANVPCEVWRGSVWSKLRKELSKCHSDTIFHSHGYKFNILLACLSPWKGGNRLVCTAHGYTDAPAWSKLSAYYFLNKWCMKALDGVAVVSEKTAGESNVKIDGIKYRLLNNGVPDKEPPSEYPIVDGEEFRETYVLSIGRLSKEKGVEDLIVAFDRVSDRHSDVHLLVAGEGPERAKLEQLALNQRCSSRIRFLGYIERPDSLIANAKVLAIPSYQEGLPITLLEGMCFGLSIIASNVGSIPRAIEHKVSGYMISPGDVEQLKGYLELALDEKVSSTGRRAREVFQADFTSESMAKAYEKWYLGLRLVK